MCMELEGRKEIRMRTIVIKVDDHTGNLLEYIKDKYRTSEARLIEEAIREYYAEEMRELERKER